MKFYDLLIIYLACGAPFGVYYFLQNRNRTEIRFLWLKSLLRFVIWIPFAIQMVARKSLFTNLYNNNFDRNSKSDAKNEIEIEKIRKYLENFLSTRKIGLSVFEFREIFDRYVGLTLEIKAEFEEISPSEKEIFRISNHPDIKLAEICLHRRNRGRLSFHQKLARRDFFEIIGDFIEKSDEPPKLYQVLSKLPGLLDDFEAQKLLENLFNETLQTQEAQNVKTPEIELWNTEKHKPLAETKISPNLQVLTATANLSNKD